MAERQAPTSRAWLTREEGEQIVARRQAGEGRIPLAAAFGIAPRTVDRVMDGTWTNWLRPPAPPARPPGARPGRPALSEQDVRELRRLRADGATLWELAIKFKVHQSLVSRAARGLVYGPLEAR